MNRDWTIAGIAAVYALSAAGMSLVVIAPVRLLRRTIRAWGKRAWSAVAEQLGLGGPRVLRRTVDRTRRLQQRAARLAYRHPFNQPNQPRLVRGLEDRGFE
jgi:hypothetical protein